MFLVVANHTEDITICLPQDSLMPLVSSSVSPLYFTKGQGSSYSEETIINAGVERHWQKGRLWWLTMFCFAK